LELRNVNDNKVALFLLRAGEPGGRFSPFRNWVSPQFKKKGETENDKTIYANENEIKPVGKSR